MADNHQQYPASSIIPTAVIPTISGMLCQSIDPLGLEDPADLSMMRVNFKKPRSKSKRRRPSAKLARSHPALGSPNPVVSPTPNHERFSSHPEMGLPNASPMPNQSEFSSQEMPRAPDLALTYPVIGILGHPSASHSNPAIERLCNNPDALSRSQLSLPVNSNVMPVPKVSEQRIPNSRTVNHQVDVPRPSPGLSEGRTSVPSTEISELDSRISNSNSGSTLGQNPPLLYCSEGKSKPSNCVSSKESFESVPPSTISSKTSSRIQKMADRVNKDRKCRLCLWAAAFVCALNVIFFLVAYDLVVRRVAESQLALHDSGEKYEAWSKTTLPVYYKLFIFNMSNPQEFMDGARPRVHEIGPYVYRMSDEKVNVTFHDNGTVTYRTKSTYFFEPALSSGSEDDLLYTVNIPFVNAADAVKDSAFLKMIIKYAGSIHNFETLRHLTVKELIWGHKSKVLDWGRMFQELPYPHPNFGLLTGFNNSVQEAYTMYTGVDNPEMMNAIYSWNGKTKLDFWEGDSCNRIFGTDASGFSPGVEPSDVLWIFNGQLCRSIPLVYKKTVNRGGIKAYRFVPPSNVFKYGPNNPQNSCYCAQGRCPPAGVLDMKACYWGAAIAFSFPHFYNADPTLRHMVLGLRPDPSLHSTEFDIFPDLGVPLRVKLRMQMNVVLDQNQALNRARHFDIIYPIFWFEAGIDSLPVNLVEKLQMAQDLPPLMKQVFVIICGVLSVVFFILLMAQTFVGWCSGGLSGFRGRGSRGSSNETISTAPEAEPQARESLNPDVEFPDSGAYKSFASPQLISGDGPNRLIDNHTLLPPYRKSNSQPGAEGSTTVVDGSGLLEIPKKKKLVGTNSDSGVGNKLHEPDESNNDYPPDYHVAASSNRVDRSSSTRSSSSVVSAEVEFHRSGSYLDMETARNISAQSVQPNEYPVQDYGPAINVVLPNDSSIESSPGEPQTSTPHSNLLHPRIMNLKPLPPVPRIIEGSLKKSAVSAPLASPEYDEVATEDNTFPADTSPRVSPHPLATSSPHATLDDTSLSHDPEYQVPSVPDPRDTSSTSLSRISANSENYYSVPPLESDL